MKRIKQDLQSFSGDDWFLLMIATALFLPIIPSSIVLFGGVLYLFIKGEIPILIRYHSVNAWLFLFVLLELPVSIFYQNWIGFLNVAGFFAIGIYTCFYRKNIHPKLFVYLLEWVLILSIPMGILGLFQFDAVSKMGGYSFWDFKIQNSPHRRIAAVFSNANIYAMMIEFFLACCLYRFVQTEKRICKGWYTLLAVFNFVLMLLTGCRAALFPLVIVIPVLLYFAKEKRLFYICIACLIALGGLVIAKPDLVPRFNDFKTIQSRVKIWKCAWKGIQTYPLFGNGPQTYRRIYPLFHGHKAPHCHNIYIDCILSYGIVGTAVLMRYVFGLIKECLSVRNKNGSLFGLMMSFMVILMIHGLVDVTLNYLSTGLFFMWIMNTSVLAMESDSDS